MTNQGMKRRTLLATLPPFLMLPAAAFASGWLAIKAYRNPDCGCCEIWVEHMRKAGFDIAMEDDADLDGRRKVLGVPADLAGCHTAMIGDKIIEGHVPAEDVIRFLTEKPDMLGLSVPGMPVGSPGMEMGDQKEQYEVFAFQSDGKREVFARHE